MVKSHVCHENEVRHSYSKVIFEVIFMAGQCGRPRPVLAGHGRTRLAGHGQDDVVCPDFHAESEYVVIIVILYKQTGSQVHNDPKITNDFSVGWEISSSTPLNGHPGRPQEILKYTV